MTTTYNSITDTNKIIDFSFDIFLYKIISIYKNKPSDKIYITVGHKWLEDNNSIIEDGFIIYFNNDTINTNINIFISVKYLRRYVGIDFNNNSRWRWREQHKDYHINYENYNVKLDSQLKKIINTNMSIDNIIHKYKFKCKIRESL